MTDFLYYFSVAGKDRFRGVDAEVCRGNGSRGMIVSGNARATEGSVGVGGDGHSPAVWGIKAWEGLLFLGGGRGFLRRSRRVRRKKGRQDQLWRGALGKVSGTDGRRRCPEGAQRPEGPAQGCGGGGTVGLVLNRAEDRRDVSEGRAGPAGGSRSWRGATGGLRLVLPEV